MYGNKRMIYYGVLTVCGIALVVISVLGITDEFWAGFGGGIAAVGALRLFLGYKYRKDEEYAKKVDVEQKDERTLFLSGKAKSFAYYLSIVGIAVTSLVLRFAGMTEAAQLCAYIMCGMLVIYLVAYVILSRKY
ncbi:MAG: hypothetical protein K6D98_06330 [Clostridiales bacterium]|nr:hypothetical protein [Clostridiales bacterium]